jgi:hypothetical protein
MLAHMGNRLALVALVIAITALLLQAFARLPASDVRARGSGAEGASIAALEARVDALESAADELRRALASNVLVPAGPPAEREPAAQDRRAADARVEELAARLALLEGRLLANDQDASERVTRNELERGRMGIDDARARAQDLAASEEERLQGLRALRGQRLEDGTDARLLVLDDMLELARGSQDGAVRADVWRQLSGVTDRRLLQPLLDALAFDTSVKAREEAAETLADFLPDPAADAALRHAADNDPDKGVREDAREYQDGR